MQVFKYKPLDYALVPLNYVCCFATIFRDAILSWNPQEDPMECENTSLHSDGPFLPQSPVGHLQQLFALMFYSKRRYIDPSPLIESLRLDTSTQQDAQVSKLIFFPNTSCATSNVCFSTVYWTNDLYLICLNSPHFCVVCP